MRIAIFSRLLLAFTFSLTVSLAAKAAPAVCDAVPAMESPSGDTGLQGFFQRLIGDPEKPQAFSGAVIDASDPECSLGLDTRPVAAEPNHRARREALN